MSIDVPDVSDTFAIAAAREAKQNAARRVAARQTRSTSDRLADHAGRLGRIRAYTDPRDPGHYRSERAGGHHSFFGDCYRAAMMGDAKAAARLREHEAFRAVTQSSGGAGTVLPRWLVDEYQSVGRAIRVVSALVHQVELGTDPRPVNMGRTATGVDSTGSNMAAQTTEGANNGGWGATAFTSADDTLTPLDYAVYQDVSRQFLFAGSPATDITIMGDIGAAWDAKVETVTCAAIMAGGTAAGTFANEAAFAPATGNLAVAVDDVIDAQTAVAADKRGRADLAVMNTRRFGAFRKLKDSTSRPLLPVSRIMIEGVSGQLGTPVLDIEGSAALETNGIDATAYPEKFAVLRSQAVYLGESELFRFEFDQSIGPSAVRLGVFGYLGVLVRNPAAVQVFTVTAAS